MKSIFRYRFSFFLSLLAFLITTCEEPEPYFNSNAQPPAESPLVLDQIADGQHITGYLAINFTPTIPGSEISMIYFLVDYEMVYGSSQIPFTYVFDTHMLPEGEYTISIGIREKNPPDLGLLNLAMVPSILYSVNVIVDHRPPTPVVLESVTWDESAQSPRLTWQKNNDPNFYAYYIQREINGMYSVSDYITDRNVTSYADNFGDGAIGFSGNFQVGVYNRDQMVLSNSLAFNYPERFPLPLDNNLGYRKPILSTLTNELFALTMEGVKAINLDDYSQARLYPMPYRYPNGLALSRDGSKLYVLTTYSPNLTVLNASTFDVLATTDLNFGGHNLVCGRADRVYVTTYWPFSGPLKILDANTLQEIGELNIEAERGLLSISSDNNTLYVAKPSPTLYEKALVYSIDISTDAPTILKQIEASDEVRDLQLSADDQTLFVIHDNDYPDPLNSFADCWDATTLTSYKHLEIPNQAFALTAQGDSLHVIYGNRHLLHFEPGGIRHYNYKTGGVIRDWKFVQAPFGCLPDVGRGKLYVFGLEGWVVNTSVIR